ncbi:SDR family NAD(P)-dependent oxidoreductase [Marinibacterium sp. SX1]|uniref:SDR family NAD(P)-dependent oxidoreductase n=1 Tax=Marinibacterium sp. SX1 TaxID=3388424 RepID=UPI003D17CCD7
MHATDRQRALITGGSAGIGLEIAKLLAADGYELIIAGSSARVETAALQLRDYGTEVIGVQSDLSTPEGVADVVNAVKNAGRLDVMVLNAGIALGGAFLELTLEQHLQLVDLNIGSTVRLSYALLPMLLDSRGKILMVSSLSAYGPTPYESVYGPSKAFMTSFGHGLREELRGTGVGVTILHPGATATEFHDRAGMQATRFGDNSWKNDPALVARQGVEALMSGVSSAIGGDERTQQAGAEKRLQSEEDKARHHADQMNRPERQ